MKRVIIVGASGLIGSELLKLLILNNNITEILALVRKPLVLKADKLCQLVTDFNLLDNYENEIYGDAIYCCLGTTKAKSPDHKEYKKIDFDYPYKLATIASKNNVPQYHLVSALGANPKSRIFYNKLKGDIEEAIKLLHIKTIHIYQPSILRGERIEKRSGEKLAAYIINVIDPLLIGPLSKYKSISAVTVAKAMMNQTFKNFDGVNIYRSDTIKKLA